MKNLFTISQEEKQRILEMHTSATKKNYIKESYHKNSRLIKESEEAVDMTSVNTALTNLNSATTSLFDGIKLKGEETDAMAYLKGGYYIDLINATYISTSMRNALVDRDLITSDKLYDLGAKFIETPNYGLCLVKNDYPKWVHNNYSSEGVYIASTAPGGDSNVDEHKEFLLEQVKYAVNEKYVEQVENNVKSLYPLIDAVITALDSVMSSLPNGKVLNMTNINGYQLTIGNQPTTLSTSQFWQSLKN